MENNKRSRSDQFFVILKNIFFIVLILQFVPMIFSGLRSTLEDALSPKKHVGYLTINGPITDSSFYIKKIDEFAKASDIKGLLLRINSPGGYSGTCQVIFNELLKFKEQKPIVALIENVGASGAYYLAASANVIIASPLSLVGSIGVFMELPNVKDLLATWKVKYRYIQSGTYKTVGSAVQEPSAAELAYLQQLSDSQYDQFVQDIAKSRGLEGTDNKTWADGKVFTGKQAFDLKLVDKLGSFSDARDEMKRLLETDEDIKFVHPKKATALMRLIGGEEDFGQDSVSLSDSVATFMSAVYQKFSMQQSTLQPQLT
jgi:protease-4